MDPSMIAEDIVNDIVVPALGVNGLHQVIAAFGRETTGTLDLGNLVALEVIDHGHRDTPLGTHQAVAGVDPGRLARLSAIQEIYDILGEKTVFVNAAGCMTLLSVYPFTPFQGSFVYTSMASAPAGAQGIRDALDVLKRKTLHKIADAEPTTSTTARCASATRSSADEGFSGAARRLRLEPSARPRGPPGLPAADGDGAGPVRRALEATVAR